jgi:hypothetical protein
VADELVDDKRTNCSGVELTGSTRVNWAGVDTYESIAWRFEDRTNQAETPIEVERAHVQGCCRRRSPSPRTFSIGFGCLLLLSVAYVARWTLHTGNAQSIASPTTTALSPLPPPIIKSRRYQPCPPQPAPLRTVLSEPPSPASSTTAPPTAPRTAPLTGPEPPVLWSALFPPSFPPSIPPPFPPPLPARPEACDTLSLVTLDDMYSFDSPVHANRHSTVSCFWLDRRFLDSRKSSRLCSDYTMPWPYEGAAGPHVDAVAGNYNCTKHNYRAAASDVVRYRCMPDGGISTRCAVDMKARIDCPGPSPPPLGVQPPHPPALPTIQSIEWVTDPPSLRFGSCAVVGSGAALAGTFLGNQIDSHDVVMHVNNIPEHYMRLHAGSRTDVLFSTLCHDRIEAADRLSIKFGRSNWCETHGTCPFTAAIFRPGVFDSVCSGNTIIDSSGGSRVNLGMSACVVSELVHYVRREGTPYAGKPTTGFHAVATMAFVCEQVDLYGFSGNATMDGHRITEDHQIEREHAVLRTLIEHALPLTEFPSEETYFAWARTRVRHMGS